MSIFPDKLNYLDSPLMIHLKIHTILPNRPETPS